MATKTIWDIDTYKPYQARFSQRLNRYIKYRRYYDGTIYSDSFFKVVHKLYAQTKALFSFLPRAVDIDVALVPGINDAWQLDTDDETIVAARDQLYRWSKWQIESDSWLEDGATLGEAMIKIVPVVDRGIVQLQRLQPEQCLLIDGIAIIVDNNRIGSNGKPYQYAEVITPESIRTFRDGEPYSYNDIDPVVDNPLGFVPIVAAANDNDNRPAFAKILPQLDSVNEMASYLADIIGRHIEPQWAAMGVERGDLTKSSGNIWFFPNADSKLQAILADIDIEGTLKFLETIKSETKANLPELAFDDLRAKDQIATESLKVQLIELQAKISRMRRRYDEALIESHQMAAMTAQIFGFAGIEALLQPHSIKASRSVLPINEMEMIQLEEARIALEMQRQAATGERFTNAIQ